MFCSSATERTGTQSWECLCRLSESDCQLCSWRTEWRWAIFLNSLGQPPPSPPTLTIYKMGENSGTFLITDHSASTAKKYFSLVFMLTFDPKWLAFCAMPRQKCPIMKNEHLWLSKYSLERDYYQWKWDGLFLVQIFFHNAVSYKGKKLLKSKGAASSTLKVWFILILAVLNF